MNSPPFSVIYSSVLIGSPAICSRFSVYIVIEAIVAILNADISLNVDMCFFLCVCFLS